MERFPHQTLKKDLDKIICNSLEKNVFSGCTVGFIYGENKKRAGDCFSYGYTGEEKHKKRVKDTTYFDLASLTKPLVTTLLVMILFEEGKLSLNDSLSKYFKSGLKGKEDITIYHLLTHSSGLPAHKHYYKKLIELSPDLRNEKIVNWILKEKLCFAPGCGSLYSDLGFILLGYIIEKQSGYSLDSFFKKKIATPLGLEKDLVFAKNNILTHGVCLMTGRCGWTNKELYGLVNDDNCRALGGVAGHAGLFGTIFGVLNLCEIIRQQYSGVHNHTFMSRETLKMFFEKKKESSWALGFDTPAAQKSSSGKCFSEKSIGHLGFTGTSFWIDLEKGITIVVLTNRVLCGDDLADIRLFRPTIHDTIMKYVMGIL